MSDVGAFERPPCLRGLRSASCCAEIFLIGSRHEIRRRSKDRTMSKDYRNREKAVRIGNKKKAKAKKKRQN